MNFIKKIFEGNVDLLVHSQFQKFSRGEFKDRALINSKKIGETYTISTTPEFANEFVMSLAKKIDNKKTKVTGAIISTNDLKKEIDFKEIKQFQGVKRYLIDKEMSGRDILEIMEKFPKAFFALSFSTDEGDVLKIKPKAPKSGKQKTKDEDNIKPTFCKLVTKDEDIGTSFVFEKPDFKKAEIKHNFLIKEIIISDELKKSEDFARIREEAKRKGTIVRISEIDGQKIKKEKEFIA